MIALDTISFTYPGSSKHIIENLSFKVNPGDRIMLTGANGAGKSTLLKIFAGLLVPNSGSVQSDLSVEKGQIGYLNQYPENQVLASTVESDVAFALENQGLPAEHIRERVDASLATTVTTHLAKKKPDKLSGGEIQKVAFAGIWAQNPLLWLLDEPAAFLDPFARHDFYQLLHSIPRDAAVVYIVSSPEDYVEDWTLYKLDEGAIALVRKSEKGNEEQVVNSIETNPVPSKSLHYPANEKGVALSVSDLTVERKELFGEPRTILNGVQFEIKPGEIVALAGRNGSGKTTLLEALSGLMKPASGNILWSGNSPEESTFKPGMVFQFPERSFFSETVMDEVSYGLLKQRMPAQQAVERAREALVHFGLNPDEIGKESPFSLSLGQARRVALASIYVLQPSAWLLDEVTAGLDEQGFIDLCTVLVEEAARGCPVILSGHDTDRFYRIADRWLFLDKGKIAAQGTARQCWLEQEVQWPKPRELY